MVIWELTAGHRETPPTSIEDGKGKPDLKFSFWQNLRYAHRDMQDAQIRKERGKKGEMRGGSWSSVVSQCKANLL